MLDPFRFLAGEGFVVSALCASAGEEPATKPSEKTPKFGTQANYVADSCVTSIELEHPP